jgi:hypothetical protein
MGKTVCSFCKKSHLIIFTCKCGQIYCMAHKLSESHNCCHNFKIAGVIELSKENPKITPSKLEKI